MKNQRKILTILAFLTVSLLTTGVTWAIFSATQPVPMSINIVGSNAFTVYTDAAHTQLYTGSAISYGDVLHGNASVQTPPFALYCVNAGEQPLTVAWNATGIPTGITMQTMKSNNGANWDALASDTPVTVQPGAQIDFGFNLQLSNPVLGSYSWSTTIYAHA